MDELTFLSDAATRSAIVRLTTEATRVWAPDEVDLVDVAAEEYFRRVRSEGRLLYPAKTDGRPLGFGERELLTLVILPVVTGFISNLLSEAGVDAFRALKSRTGKTDELDKEQVIAFDPEKIRPLLEQEAQASGISSRQTEELARILCRVTMELLLNNGQELVENGGANP